MLFAHIDDAGAGHTSGERKQDLPKYLQLQALPMFGSQGKPIEISTTGELMRAWRAAESGTHAPSEALSVLLRAMGAAIAETLQCDVLSISVIILSPLQANHVFWLPCMGIQALRNEDHRVVLQRVLALLRHVARKKGALSAFDHIYFALHSPMNISNQESRLQADSHTPKAIHALHKPVVLPMPAVEPAINPSPAIPISPAHQPQLPECDVAPTHGVRRKGKPGQPREGKDAKSRATHWKHTQFMGADVGHACTYQQFVKAVIHNPDHSIAIRAEEAVQKLWKGEDTTHDWLHELQAAEHNPEKFQRVWRGIATRFKMIEIGKHWKAMKDMQLGGKSFQSHVAQAMETHACDGPTAVQLTYQDWCSRWGREEDVSI